MDPLVKLVFWVFVLWFPALCPIRLSVGVVRQICQAASRQLINVSVLGSWTVFMYVHSLLRSGLEGTDYCLKVC